MSFKTVANVTAYDRRLSQLIKHMQSTAKVDKSLLSEVTKLSSGVLDFSAVARQRLADDLVFGIKVGLNDHTLCGWLYHMRAEPFLGHTGEYELMDHVELLAKCFSFRG